MAGVLKIKIDGTEGDEETNRYIAERVLAVFDAAMALHEYEAGEYHDKYHADTVDVDDELKLMQLKVAFHAACRRAKEGR